MKTYKLIIAGSRDITDYWIIRNAVIDSGLWDKHGRNLHIISGTAQGADTLGEQFAINNSLKLTRMPVDWGKLIVPGARIKKRLDGTMYNAAAGAMRNIEMGKIADGLVVVIKNNSRGSSHMLEWMQKAGKFTYVVHV